MNNLYESKFYHKTYFFVLTLMSYRDIGEWIITESLFLARDSDEDNLIPNDECFTRGLSKMTSLFGMIQIMSSSSTLTTCFGPICYSRGSGRRGVDVVTTEDLFCEEDWDLDIEYGIRSVIPNSVYESDISEFYGRAYRETFVSHQIPVGTSVDIIQENLKWGHVITALIIIIIPWLLLLS